MLQALLTLALLALPKAERTMVVTIDDLPVNSTRHEFSVKRQVTLDLVATLRRERIPAIGFVNEAKLEVDGKVSGEERALLQHWLAHGIELGNHSYSHLDLHRVDLSAFLEDVRKGDRQTRALAGEAGLPYRYFRHPYLHTGRTLKDREAVEATLEAMGLQVAPITIDNGEWIYARAYDLAIDSGKLDLAAEVRTDYVRYMEAMCAYYEAQSMALLGYELPQILLLHANRLNASTLPVLIQALRTRGYRFIPLDVALKDPAYRHEDRYFGPAGITWLHRWALTEQRPAAFFAGEPEVPAFVKAASGLNL